MSRLGLAFAVVLCVGGSSVAFAQSPGSGPPMPMAMDLAKVPVGSWADYNMTMGTLPPMKMRMALVAKSPAGNIVETSVEGGMMASAAGKMVMQMTVAPGMEGQLKKMVMQLGSSDPMEMPVELSGGKPFTKPNPKNLVGSEAIKVPAGSFKTKHYRDKTPNGDKIDFWISDTVPPFGVVKIEVDQKSNPNPQVKGKMGFELNSMGKDAKAVVTKAPKPFDQAALMQQMIGAQGGGAGAGPGAKPAAPPAPPPAPPPPPKK